MQYAEQLNSEEFWQNFAKMDEFKNNPEEIKALTGADFFRTIHWYWHLYFCVSKHAKIAKRGEYDWKMFQKSSGHLFNCLRIIAPVLEVTGINNLRDVEGPCVIVGNHMSLLETMLLPCLTNVFRPTTFVVKEALLTYPVFGPVMRAVTPVAVGRSNPKEDLKKVMTDGQKLLESGVSIVIFPQSTRTHEFDESQFNSLAARLSFKAKVPLVPLALKTDFLQNGKMLKDFGPMDSKKEVHFAFGKPITEGNTKARYAESVEFIVDKLQQWGVPTHLNE